MAAGALAMSARERERLVVIAQVCGRVVTQGGAAERLGICVRQVKRLVRAYRAEGDAGLVSRQSGRARTVGSRRTSANGRANCSGASIVILVRRWPARSWRSSKGSLSRARYGAIESARRPPVTHPHSTGAPKGTFLLCAIRGHFYFALTVIGSELFKPAKNIASGGMTPLFVMRRNNRPTARRRRLIEGLLESDGTIVSAGTIIPH